MMNSISNIKLVTTLSCLLVLNITLLHAQHSAIIFGKIEDKETGQALSNSNVTIMGTEKGSAANQKGYYEILHVPPGKYSLKASRIGYESMIVRDVKIQPGQRKEINFHLAPKVLEMQGVSIEADRPSSKYLTEVSRIGIQEINPRGISNVPGSLDDVTRVLALYSNVVPESDFTSFFAVRGGSPDQNLVVFDGIAVPNPYRLRLVMGGGLSIFNPYTTEDVRLHVGGFPAEYGDFLSSVLEVNTREGNRERFGCMASINILDANAVAEGPLPKHKGSWLFSARRTYFDLIANRVAEHQSAYPFTSDINTKIVVDINKKNKLSLSAQRCNEAARMSTTAYDFLKIDEESKINLYSLTWENTISNTLYDEIKLAYYREKFDYETTIQSGSEISEFGRYKSKVNNVSLRENFLYKINDNHWIQRGLCLSNIESNLNFEHSSFTIVFARREIPRKIVFENKSIQIANYLEYTSQLTSRLQSRLGIRYDYSHLIKKGDLSSRASLLYKINDHITMNAFWGQCYQYPNAHSIFNRDVQLNIGKNLNELKAEKATHYVLGTSKKWGNDISIKIEFYYKDIDRYLLPKDDLYLIPHNHGVGYSKGFELLLEKRGSSQDRYNALISYSYCISRYKDEDASYWRPFNFDRRHGLSIFVNIKLKRYLSCNFLYRYSSGLPYNNVIGYVETYSDRTKYMRDTENYQRFLSYQRFDLRLNYEYRSGNRLFAIYIDLTNILNRKNIYDRAWYRTVEKDSEGEILYRDVVIRTIPMLPFVPSFGISFSF